MAHIHDINEVSSFNIFFNFLPSHCCTDFDEIWFILCSDDVIWYFHCIIQINELLGSNLICIFTMYYNMSLCNITYLTSLNLWHWFASNFVWMSWVESLPSLLILRRFFFFLNHWPEIIHISWLTKLLIINHWIGDDNYSATCPFHIWKHLFQLCCSLMLKYSNIKQDKSISS